MILLPPPSFLSAFWDMEGAGFITHRYQYLCIGKFTQAEHAGRLLVYVLIGPVHGIDSEL